MADAQSKAEKRATALRRAEELKKKKKAAAESKARKDKAPTDKTDAEPTAIGPTEDKANEEDGSAGSADPSSAPGGEAEVATTASLSDTDNPDPNAHPPAEGSATAPAAVLEATAAGLQEELAAIKQSRDEVQLICKSLEREFVSLDVLHKGDKDKINGLQSALASLQEENADLRAKLQKSEAEALRLRKKENRDSGGTDIENLDELEDEERKKLEARLREVETENADLRRGIWHERRKEMQAPMDEAGGGHLLDVALGQPRSPSTARRQGGFGDFLTSGLNALTGAGGHEPHDEDGFLDDEDDFDEDAFRQAQEEAAHARIERIKEVKRGLKNWEGWRIDLLEGRRGGGEGVGEIFEV